MFFFFASLIIAIACSVITIRTLVGYSDLRMVYKIVVSVFIVLGWFAPLTVHFLRAQTWIPVNVYAVVFTVLYSLMGFVFLLFIVIMLRDVVWYAIYGMAKLLKIDGWHINPQNMSLLNKANMIVLGCALLVSAYAFYQGYKLPNVEEVYIYSDKIQKNMRIVQLSDLHVSRGTSVSRVRDIVNQINLLDPDVIVLTGDTIDDNVLLIEEQLNVLKELSAPFGIYSVMGNHEFYNDVYAAKRVLDSLGLKFLFNGGVLINNTNVFLAGIPDLNTMYERVNFWRTLNKSKKENYKVLLSHTPVIIDSLSKGLVDLVLSGHTHGGQIFPFHLFVKQANNYLAGKYHVNGTDLYVSRGAGAWGPMMRLFAPSDIVVINLLKK